MVKYNKHMHPLMSDNHIPPFIQQDLNACNLSAMVETIITHSLPRIIRIASKKSDFSAAPFGSKSCTV